MRGPHVRQPSAQHREPDELAASAIGELGNIVGSAFVNALADRARTLILHPSPPTILNDMAVALVESVYAEILSQGGEVVMIDTVFEDHRAYSGPPHRRARPASLATTSSEALTAPVRVQKRVPVGIGEIASSKDPAGILCGVRPRLVRGRNDSSTRNNALDWDGPRAVASLGRPRARHLRTRAVRRQGVDALAQRFADAGAGEARLIVKIAGGGSVLGPANAEKFKIGRTKRRSDKGTTAPWPRPVARFQPTRRRLRYARWNFTSQAARHSSGPPRSAATEL